MIPGKTDLTIRRDEGVIVVEEVPAMVCPQCGEASVASDVSQRVYKIAEGELEAGPSRKFCKYLV